LLRGFLRHAGQQSCPDSNSLFLLPEKPLVLSWTQGILSYRPDPKLISAGCALILKASEPFGPCSKAAHQRNARVGVLEMPGRCATGPQKPRQQGDGLPHLEVLHGLVTSSQTKGERGLKSTFEKTPPIRAGRLVRALFEFIEEMELAF